MTDKVTLTIDMTAEKLQHIEQLAQERGCSAPGDYLLALVESDSDEPVDDEFDFDTQEGLITGLQESLHQAIKDDVRPISALWDELKDE